MTLEKEAQTNITINTFTGISSGTSGQPEWALSALDATINMYLKAGYSGMSGKPSKLMRPSGLVQLVYNPGVNGYSNNPSWVAWQQWFCEEANN